MKCRDKVRVGPKARESLYRGRTGVVLAESAPGALVEVEFDDEVIAHSFYPDELELILDEG
jgi:hypothetical protein